MGSYSRVKGPEVKYSQHIWKPPNGEARELPTMRTGGLEEQVLNFSLSQDLYIHRLSLGD